jgi:hypothetical protein
MDKMSRLLIGTLLVVALVLAGLLVERVRAYDEYLATTAPLTDVTSGTNAAFVIDFGQTGARPRVQLTGNITIASILNARAGVNYDVWFEQDATGSRTVAWPSNIEWQGGSAPTISATAGYQDRVTMMWDPSEAKWMMSILQAYR